MSRIRIRSATERDLPVLHTMVHELAQFLNYEHVFLATANDLRQHLFIRPLAKCLIAELTESNSAIGYAIYYTTLSTFRGRPGLHLEDIFVRDGFREKKVGRMLIHYLCRIAREMNCCRIQWEAPIDNDRANKFYNSLDVPTVGGWVTYRITNAIEDMAHAKPTYLSAATLPSKDRRPRLSQTTRKVTRRTKP